MKYKELLFKWRISIISMSVAATMLLTALIVYIYSTIGSL